MPEEMPEEKVLEVRLYAIKKKKKEKEKKTWEPNNLF